MIFDAIKRWMGLGSANGSSNGRSDGDSDGEIDMISCEEALARVYEFLDGELDEVMHGQVEAHFEVCTQCYPHLASERSFQKALRRAIDDRGAPESVRRRILELLEREEASQR